MSNDTRQFAIYGGPRPVATTGVEETLAALRDMSGKPWWDKVLVLDLETGQKARGSTVLKKVGHARDCAFSECFSHWEQRGYGSPQ